MKMNEKKNILIVNDSPMLTAVIKAVVETHPGWIIAGNAGNGKEAVAMTDSQRFDLVLMDIHMPVMDGVEATGQIMRKWPKSRILITTATVNRNISYIFNSLKLGAIDYVKPPALSFKPGDVVSTERLKKDGAIFLHKINTALSVTLQSPYKKMVPIQKTGTIGSAATKPLSPKQPVRQTTPGPFIGIGASTGGPTTLAILLKNLPTSLPGPVLISLHIDPGFDHEFSKWLTNETGMTVQVPRTGTRPLPGHVYLAPGGYNMVVTTGGVLYIEHPVKNQIYTPGIDRMLSSMAKHLGRQACGIILTGMGDDGAKGLKQIKEKKGKILAQDKHSSIIDGMPQAARMSCNIPMGMTPPGLAKEAAAWMQGW